MGNAAPVGPVSPVMSVSTAIIEEDRVVLVQRGRSPGKGAWSIPGGKVHVGETLAEAAAREALEETNLEVRIGAERWVLTVRGDDETSYEIHCFAATRVSGSLRAGDDAAQAKWVHESELGEYELTDGLKSKLLQLFSEPG